MQTKERTFRFYPSKFNNSILNVAIFDNKVKLRSNFNQKQFTIAYSDTFSFDTLISFQFRIIENLKTSKYVYFGVANSE